MLWFKALHVIFTVTWFSGLFYLPRLFIYHVLALDSISQERFKIMEKKLFYIITLPSAILSTTFGIIVLSYGFSSYIRFPWMHLKLTFVVFLWIYTLMCWKYLQDFLENKNMHTSKFYRIFNEIPSILLIAIVILVIVKPNFY